MINDGYQSIQQVDKIVKCRSSLFMAWSQNYTHKTKEMVFIQTIVTLMTMIINMLIYRPTPRVAPIGRPWPRGTWVFRDGEGAGSVLAWLTRGRGWGSSPSTEHTLFGPICSQGRQERTQRDWEIEAEKKTQRTLRERAGESLEKRRKKKKHRRESQKYEMW